MCQDTASDTCKQKLIIDNGWTGIGLRTYLTCTKYCTLLWICKFNGAAHFHYFWPDMPFLCKLGPKN